MIKFSSWCAPTILPDPSRDAIAIARNIQGHRPDVVKSNSSV
jgi:hypothetical protein